ncbi:hypothetical protein ECDEC9B_3357 [Escherichia coli DEC9B]|nr:hypothetical protein ECDEC9B_3357 [Escherichia coli DEC9B]
MKPLAADLAVYPRWRGEHTTVGSWEDEEIGLILPSNSGHAAK